ncbi:MAG: thioredoxin domain-containing protein [Candidatus Omnitrophica bacterium]|nr:thioredoxin domain-containing protein [Candidatus Omnitrophota bacterium]
MNWKIFLIVLLFSVNASASTILLKSGQSIDASIVEVAKNFVKVDVQGTVMTYYQEEIQSVNGTPIDTNLPFVEQVASTHDTSPPASSKKEDSPVAPRVPEGPVFFPLNQYRHAQDLARQTNQPLIFLVDNEAPTEKSDKGILVYIDGATEMNYMPAQMSRALMARGGQVVLPLAVMMDIDLTKVIKILPHKTKEIPIDGSFILGNVNAPVTMVMFADFQCPGCASEYPQVKALLDSYPNQLRVVIKHFPLPFHQMAFPAAKAAAAAGQQGKFYEMAELLFKNSSQLSEDKFKELAGELKLDLVQFIKDYQDGNGQLTDRITRDMALGKHLEVGGTPDYFIDGGRIPPPYWKKTIDQFLADNKSP